VQHVRIDHDPQRQLLQMRQLRDDFRLRLMSSCGLYLPERLDAAPYIGVRVVRCVIIWND